MNFYSLIGSIMAIGVLFAGLKMSTDNIMIFVDKPSLFIVLGGTIASTAISFQFNHLITLLKIFVKKFFFGKRTNYSSVIAEIMKLIEAYRQGESLSNLAGRVRDPFLKECVQLWAENLLELEDFLRVITERADNINKNYADDTKKIQLVAKFAPAFGMMGTTIGMVVLLSKLGSSGDDIAYIGQAMSVAIITTLYGVILAYMVFLPIAENLKENNKEIFLKNQIVIEGMKLLLKKVNPMIVGIELNSYLNPSDRLDWKKVLGK